MNEQFTFDVDLPTPVLEITEVRITCGETNVVVTQDQSRHRKDLWAVFVSRGYIAKVGEVELRGYEAYNEACERARDYVMAVERRRLVHAAVRQALD